MNDKIKQAIENCVSGLYDANEEHLSDKNTKFLPSKDEIFEILEETKKILYPKYFAHAEQTTKSDTRKHLEKLSEKLKKQIELAFAYESSQNCHAVSLCEAISNKADEVVAHFISELPNVYEMMKLDIKATLAGDPAAGNIDLVLLTYPGIDATFTYRIANILFRSNVPLIPRIMTEYAHSKTGIDIHPGATIGKSFVIDHGTGIVIGETTEIGDYAKLYQGVTLGAISLKNATELVGKKRHPTLGNNVTIYSGATVLGGKTVLGDGSVIGSSAFITKSVEDGMTVAIEKPKLRLYYSDDTPVTSNETKKTDNN